MQTHQVCEQMVLLSDEDKMRARGTASLKEIALSPSPYCLSGFLPTSSHQPRLSLQLLLPLLA